MNHRTGLLLAALLLTGCRTTPDAREPVTALETTVYDALAAELLPQLPEGLAVAVAYPVSERKDSAQRQRLERYPDQLLAALVRARNATTPQKKVSFLTREHLVLLLEEQGLQWSTLVPTDPRTRVKLKAIKAVQAYVVWRIDRGKAHRETRDASGAVSGDMAYEDWTLMVISVESGEVLAASRVHRRWLGWGVE